MLSSFSFEKSIQFYARVDVVSGGHLDGPFERPLGRPLDDHLGGVGLVEYPLVRPLDDPWVAWVLLRILW